MDNKIIEYIQKFALEECGITGQISDAMTLKEIGFNSLQILKMIMFMEKKFKIEFANDMLVKIEMYHLSYFIQSVERLIEESI